MNRQGKKTRLVKTMLKKCLYALSGVEMTFKAIVNK